jgi:hypothetical protein
MQEHLAEAREILKNAIVIDTLGGAVVHPTPSVTKGAYEEIMVRDGWTISGSKLD